MSNEFSLNKISFGLITDIDECSINDGGCENECKNTEGGFRCSCRNGFKLHSNGKDCIRKFQQQRSQYLGFVKHILILFDILKFVVNFIWKSFEIRVKEGQSDS